MARQKRHHAAPYTVNPSAAGIASAEKSALRTPTGRCTTHAPSPHELPLSTFLYWCSLPRKTSMSSARGGSGSSAPDGSSSVAGGVAPVSLHARRSSAAWLAEESPTKSAGTPWW